jgi:hypothetical protein
MSLLSKRFLLFFFHFNFYVLLIINYSGRMEYVEDQKSWEKKLFFFFRKYFFFILTREFARLILHATKIKKRVPPHFYFLFTPRRCRCPVC